MKSTLRGLVILVLLVGIGAGLSGRLTEALPGGDVLPGFVSLPETGAATDAVQVLNTAHQDASHAIQQGIQHSNDEQVQAIAARDPSLMADTLTADHYQELVQINQDLLNNGVASIKLVKLEWGAVAVDGATATATTYETWTTTLSDGSTDQLRDRNDYSLVLDNGNWKITADA